MADEQVQEEAVATIEEQAAPEQAQVQVPDPAMEEAFWQKLVEDSITSTVEQEVKSNPEVEEPDIAKIVTKAIAKAVAPLARQISGLETNQFMESPDGKAFQEIRKYAPSISPQAARELAASLYKTQIESSSTNLGGASAGLTDQDKLNIKIFGLKADEYSTTKDESNEVRW